MVWLFLMLSSTASAGELWLKVGEVRFLPAPRDAAVRVGARGIIRVVDADQGVRLIALKPGFTSMAVGENSYTVRVSHSLQKDFLVRLRKTVDSMMGLKVSVGGTRAEVSGTLLRFSDWQKLAALAREMDGEYSFRARALPDVAEAAFKHLNTLAHQRGFPILRFSAAPEFTAHLPQAAAPLKAAVEGSLKPYGIRVETSISELSVQPLVRTRVILAEVSRSFSRAFGVSWPSEYQAQVLPSLGGGESSLTATLKALEAQGQAQILASPNLICRSGSEARFHAGGEFPVRTTSRHFQDVTWKPHGVVLNVKPKADFQGAISLEVETEVSILDMANAVEGIPALKKSSVKSHFDLAGRRTIALSGLLRQELGQAREGLPLLGGLPVLGPLFSSRNFQDRRSELVIFVTPEIFTPEEDAAPQMPQGWVRDGS